MTPPGGFGITLEAANNYVKSGKGTALSLKELGRMTPEQIENLTPEQKRNLTNEELKKLIEQAEARARAVMKLRRGSP